jgi:leucyl aminopeptidase
MNYQNHIEYFKNCIVSLEEKKTHRIIITDSEKSNLNNEYFLCIKKYETDYEQEKIGGEIYNLAKSMKLKNFSVLSEISLSMALVANGFILKSWLFDKYKTKKYFFQSVNFITNELEKENEKLKDLLVLTESVLWSRELCNTPANDLNPETFKNIAQKELEKSGLQIKILNKKDLKDLNMNLLLGVAQGSIYDPYVLVVTNPKAKETSEKICLVGKGVTFDTGGISLKPSDSMHDMIGDMSGAAAVLAACKSLASTDLNFCGIVGLVENAVGSNAQRPGDILTSMNGKTVQILNTDAEGRLVLGDLVFYASTLGYTHILTIATLTGASKVVFGDLFAGLCCKNEEFKKLIFCSGKISGERCWALPMCSGYNKYVEGDVADLNNISVSNKGAGVIVGAKFIEALCATETIFAHLDIANMAFSTNALSSEKYNGYGVRILNTIIKNFIRKECCAFNNCKC